MIERRFNREGHSSKSLRQLEPARSREGGLAPALHPQQNSQLSPLIFLISSVSTGTASNKSPTIP